MAKKVLIIDEEEILIEPVIDRLNYEYPGIEITHCLTGDEGLSKILEAKKQYDLVILDMMLPVDQEKVDKLKIDELLYGLYVLKQVRQSNTTLPINCYTVFNDKVVIEQIALNGAKHFSKISSDGFDQLFIEINKILNIEI